jgi:hypothetical protein
MGGRFEIEPAGLFRDGGPFHHVTRGFPCQAGLLRAAERVQPSRAETQRRRDSESETDLSSARPPRLCASCFSSKTFHASRRGTPRGRPHGGHPRGAPLRDAFGCGLAALRDTLLLVEGFSQSFAGLGEGAIRVLWGTGNLPFGLTPRCPVSDYFAPNDCSPGASSSGPKLGCGLGD